MIGTKAFFDIQVIDRERGIKMLKPDLETVRKMSEQYNTIPVTKEFYADVITPINLLKRISSISNRYFLLESVEGGEKWGRY